MQTKIAIINRQLRSTITHSIRSRKNISYRHTILWRRTQANVDKIKRANGLSSNNIHNGQTLVIPQ